MRLMGTAPMSIGWKPIILTIERQTLMGLLRFELRLQASRAWVLPDYTTTPIDSRGIELRPSPCRGDMQPLHLEPMKHKGIEPLSRECKPHILPMD